MAGGYEIIYSHDAREDLKSLPRSAQVRVLGEVPTYLAHQPAAPSRRRVAMDENPLGVSWELRLGNIRVFYDVREVPTPQVRVIRIGVKDRQRLRIRGQEVVLRL
jgi:mRNA-degrading endonuclease RelE of RelBE toxin-antitoxin system